MSRGLCKRLMGVHLVGLLVVLTACGGSADEGVAGVDDVAPTSTPTSASDVPQAFCGAVAEFERTAEEADSTDSAQYEGAFGDPDRARQLIDDIRRTAPSDIRNDADLFFSAMLIAADPIGETHSTDPRIDQMTGLEIQAIGERVFAYTQQQCGGPVNEDPGG